jgi:hypothetical protein
VTRYTASVQRCAIILVVVAACGTDKSTFVCHAPAQPFYDCQPIAPASADANACTGGPAWRPTNGPDDAPLTTEDPDLVFPEHCMFHLNECGCCYESGRGFECYAGHWEEPL